MHRDNNICFHCRKTFKLGYKCPICGRDLVLANHTIRVPKHNKDKEWKIFIKWLSQWPYYKQRIEEALK